MRHHQTQKKVKRKDISSTENLDQALEDEGLDLPTLVPLLHERSSLLIEETDIVNKGTKNNPNNVFVAKSLTNQEKKNIVIFLKETQVSFSWSYADMPGLDLELVVHQFVVRPDAKLVKKNF